MSNFKLMSVSIKNFRGFKKEVFFDIKENYNSIIINGHNGIGKTSFYDAIEWVITGELFRYFESNEEKRCKFINFQPAEKGELARVALRIANETTSFIVVRELVKFDNISSDYGEKNTKFKIIKSTGEELYEEEAYNYLDEMLINKEWKGKLKFKEVFSQYHLLTQDKLKYFIQGIKMPERYEQIANLLGNEKYLKYNEKIDSVIKEFDKKIKESEKEIIDRKNKIELLEAKGIEDNNIDITKIDDIEYAFNQLTKKLEKYNQKYKCDYRFDDKEYTINNLNDAVNNSKKLNEYINQCKEKYILKEEKILILKKDLNNYLRDIRDLSVIEKSLSIYNKLEKFNYLKIHLSDFMNYRKQHYNKSIEIQGINNAILNKKEKLDFVRDIYIELKEVIKNISKINIEESDEENKINLLKEYINTKRLSFDNEKYSVYMSNEEITVLDLKDKKNIDAGYVNLDQRLQIIKYGLMEELNKLNLCYKNMYDKNINATKEVEKLEEELNMLLEMDDDLKEILLSTKKHIESLSINENDDIKCPVCNSEFKNLELVNIIDSKLNKSNIYVKDKQAKINNLNEKIKEFNLKIKEINKKINEKIDIFIKELQDIFMDIQKKGTLLNSDVSKLENEKEKVELSMNDIHKEFIKYSDILNLLNINEPNLDVVINNNYSFLYNELLKLGYKYEHYQLENINDLNKKLQNSIHIYKENLNKYGIDDKDLEKSFDENINLVKLEIRKLNNSYIDIETIKNNLCKLRDIVMKSENYSKWIEEKNNLKLLNESCIKNKKIVENLSNVKEAISNTVYNLNKKAIEENEEFVNFVFKRIFTHPYYRKIKFDFGENSRGRKTLKVMCCHNNCKTEINPAYIFSSTQINILALSIFLSISIGQKCTNLDLILLDDPVQNMDDMNVLAFIDVLRSCIDQDILNKQIIISTHDSKIANLFIKKFRYYKNRVYNFMEYTSDGPRIVSN